MIRKRALLLRADGGAVMVESIIAIPLLLAFFAMILQYSYLLMASLVVNHAAVVAARSASVIIPDDPTAYSDGSDIGTFQNNDRLATIEDAARAPMHALQAMPFQTSSFNPDKLTVSLDGAEGKDTFEPTGVVKATVTFPYTCEVPFGGSLICGLDGAKSLSAVAAMPIQGAEYAYY
jgi:Flp pilus assembly protein TadG